MKQSSETVQVCPGSIFSVESPAIGLKNSMIHGPRADPTCRLAQARGSMNYSRRDFSPKFSLVFHWKFHIHTFSHTHLFFFCKLKYPKLQGFWVFQNCEKKSLLSTTSVFKYWLIQRAHSKFEMQVYTMQHLGWVYALACNCFGFPTGSGKTQ